MPGDVAEAQKLREVATGELQDLKRQRPQVNRIATALIRRRALNHFGDDIQITFRKGE